MDLTPFGSILMRSGVAADPDLIHKISVINQQEKDNRWLATNLGIETVSPSMVKKHLGVKTKPFGSAT